MIVLLSVFVLSLLVMKVFQGTYNIVLSGRIAMAVMLVFTAMAHFVFTKGMAMMLPSFIPAKTEIIYLTGVMEFAAAVGMFIPSVRVLTGWLLIAFFILVLPANVYAALHHINYQKGTLDGNGLVYLWFRVPLQVLFIVWTYFSTIKV